MNDVYKCFEQKKFVGIHSDAGSNQDAAKVSPSKLRFDNLFRSLSMVYEADLGFVVSYSSKLPMTKSS